MKKTILLSALVVFLMIIPSFTAKANEELYINLNETYQLDEYTSYGSTDSTIAKVDDTGLITGIAMGNCEVIAISNNEAIVYTIHVLYDESLYIDEDGLDLEEQIFNIDDTSIIIGKTTLKELSNLDNYTLVNDYFEKDIAPNYDLVVDTTLYYFLINKTTNVAEYKIYTSPAIEYSTIGDCVVVGIHPFYGDYELTNKDNYSITNYSWMSNAFSVDNISDLYEFYDTFKKKFSGYVNNDNVKFDYSNSTYRVAVKLKSHSDKYFDGFYYKKYSNDPYYLIFECEFDPVSRKCKSIGSYISKYVTGMSIFTGYCSFRMWR